MHHKSPEDVLIEETMPKTTKKPKLEPETRTWIAKPVLAPEFTEDPIYTKAFIGILKEKKTISRAIQSISTILPGFNHLKRCSGQKILLCPTMTQLSKTSVEDADQDSNICPDDVKTLLRDKGFDLSLLEDNLEIISVPAKSPKTRAQAAAARKAWPVNFHPDIKLETIISGKEFNDEQLELIENCMRVTIEAAEREAVGSKNCTGSAMIVDPEEGRVLALAAAKIDLHPMWHAAMIAIDLVAKMQGGGAWELSQEKVNERITSDSSKKTQDYKPEGKRQFKEDAPLCFPTSLSDIVFPELKPFVIKRDSKSQKNSKTLEDGIIDSESKYKEGPYLCTGFWVFLLQEPCSLCAMALLHSRASKIFYGRPNFQSGVLGSKTVLHSLPGLNHRYQVWCGILENECTQVSKNRL